MISRVSPLVLRARRVRRKLRRMLREHDEGLTISDFVRGSGLSRSAIVVELAKLEGAEKISMRRVGMAKIYSLVDDEMNVKKILKGGKENG